MYLLLTDETNLEPAENVRFFIYGGLFFAIDHLVEIDREIAAIREHAGYRQDDLLKFETRHRPEHVDIAAATAAKRSVVDLCRRTGCRFIAYGALHAIIANRPRNEQVLFGTNSVIDRFNRFLEREDDYGIVLTDTLPVQAPNQYVREKFMRGLQFGDDFRPLPRVRLYGTTCAGASHLASAIDIVLGCFRYAVNAPRNREAAGEMIASVIDLMWGYRRNNEAFVLESGLVLRPMLANIQVEAYRREYEQLLRELDELDALGRMIREGA
jgi:hypothetical protein